MNLLLIFIVWVIGFGLFSYTMKNRISEELINHKIPTLIGYYIFFIPIILMEEALTIEVPYFWGIIPMIIVFSMFFLVLFIIQKIMKKDYKIAVILFGSWGWMNEFLLVGRIRKVNGIILVILSVLCWSIYAVMAVIPAYYLQRTIINKDFKK